jgi:membrane protease YdiL (CAAX protease family)
MKAIPRLLFYCFLFIAGSVLYGWMLLPAGLLVAAPVSTFLAGLTANFLSMRVFERAPVIDVGLRWHAGALRHLWLGAAAGFTAAVMITFGAVLVGAARLEPDPNFPASLASAAFVTVMLILGATGEELTLRGYGFQVLAAVTGVPIAVVSTSVVFGLLHMSNQNASTFGIVNTVLYGIVLGWAMLRSGDLWLPTGIHFGWNWALPLAGVPLSGFTMGWTGYTLRWNVSDFWSGGAYGPEGGVLTTIVVAGLLVFLWKVRLTPDVPLLLRCPSPEVACSDFDPSSSSPSRPPSPPKN